MSDEERDWWKKVALDTARAYAEALDERDSLRGVVQAVQTDAEFVETTWKLKEPDPLSDWRKGVEWMIGRTRNVITDGLAAAADAPQPEPVTSTHTRPTPQADRRRAELERLGVLHPDTADQPPDLTPQQRYEWALREGKSETQARAEGWPGVSFCGHTSEEGCTGHGDF